MYSSLRPYEYDLLRERSEEPVLGDAPEDNPEVDESYRKLLSTPGMGYDFEV